MYGIPVCAAAYAVQTGILTFVLSCLTISEMGCMAGRSFDIMRVSEMKVNQSLFQTRFRKGGFL